jgi:hypothetical protein
VGHGWIRSLSRTRADCGRTAGATSRRAPPAGGRHQQAGATIRRIPAIDACVRFLPYLGCRNSDDGSVAPAAGSSTSSGPGPPDRSAPCPANVLGGASVTCPFRITCPFRVTCPFRGTPLHGSSAILSCRRRRPACGPKMHSSPASGGGLGSARSETRKERDRRLADSESTRSETRKARDRDRRLGERAIRVGDSCPGQDS